MLLWVVKATWTEDEAEASEQWQVNAPTAHEAVREVSTHLRFQPHHVEAAHWKGEQDLAPDLPPGEARGLPAK